MDHGFLVRDVADADVDGVVARFKSLARGVGIHGVIEMWRNAPGPWFGVYFQVTADNDAVDELRGALLTL